MTENKRFTITGDRSISDHQKKRLYDLNDFDGMISVTECLNELNDENEAFKNSDNITELETEIMKLKEENKELKEEIEALKIEISELRESEKDNYNITDGLW